MRLRRRRVLVIGVAALLGAVIVAGLEAIGRRYPSLMPPQWQIEDLAIHYPFTVQPDPELGFIMPANQREVIRTRDYTFVAETDARGFPNRDPWADNPSLVFLGDSLIVGAGVGLDASVTGLLTRRLPDQSIVNLGLAGAGPERQARIYKRFAHSWRPVLVVSCLFLASDVENDTHFVRWMRDGQGSDYNQFRLRLAGAARDKGLLQRFLDHSWLLYSTEQVVRQWVAQGEDVPPRFRFEDGTEILFERHALEFARTPVESDDSRLAPFVAAVERLRELAARSGSQFLAVLIPSKEELYAVSAAVARQNLAGRIKQRLSAANTATLDLYPVFERAGAARAPYYSRDMHLNELGNHLVAEEFARWFLSHGPGRDAR